MNLELDACAATNHGQPCSEPPTMVEPVPLCDEHKVQVALLVTPEVLTAVLAEIRLSRHHHEGQPVPSAEAGLIRDAQHRDMPEVERHESLVYFLANGGRVKIGYTKSLVNRLRALSLRSDAVLLLLAGGQPLERALHLKFRTCRIGDSEWFELSPEVVDFIASKKQKPLTSKNRRPMRFGSPARRPRRTRDQIRAELQMALDEHASNGGGELHVKPLADRVGANRRIVRELLAEMGVRPAASKEGPR